MNYDKKASEFLELKYGNDEMYSKASGEFDFYDITDGMDYIIRKTRFHRILMCFLSFIMGVLIGAW